MADVPKFEDTDEIIPSFDDTDPEEAAAVPDGPSKLESFGRGAAQGASFGLADEATGGIEALRDLLTRSDVSLSQLPEAYKTRRDESREAYKRAEEANPKSYLAGSVTGGVATAALPGVGALNAAKGAKIGSALIRGAGQGALAGFGASEGDSVGDISEDTLKGAAGGAVLGGLSKGGETAAGKLAKRYLDKADARTIKALGPTLNQQKVLNEKGAANALAQELRDEGVVKFGSDVEGMAPRLEALLASKGKRIGDIRDEVDAAGASTIDFGRLSKKGDAMAAFSDATNEATKDSAEAYARNASNLAKVPKRSLREAQEEVMALNEQIPFDKVFADRTPGQQAFSKLRGDVVEQMDDSVRQYSPERAAELAALKSQFGLLKDGEKILENSVARSQRNADIGMRDMLMGGLVKNKGDAPASLTQAAVMGASKLARERGNSAMGATYGKMSQLLSGDPERLGKFGKVLHAAAGKGKEAVMAAHVALMQDPEYRALIGSDDGDAK